MTDQDEAGRGFWYGAAAYGMWGLFPLFWPLLEPSAAVDILANRMVWSLVAVVLMLLVQRRWAWIRPSSPSPAGSPWSPPRPLSSPSTGASTSGV
ncbi:hypothetical protein GCM10025734_49700 [Kitasatospora paranensis]